MSFEMGLDGFVALEGWVNWPKYPLIKCCAKKNFKGICGKLKVNLNFFEGPYNQLNYNQEPYLLSKITNTPYNSPK